NLARLLAAAAAHLGPGSPAERRVARRRCDAGRLRLWPREVPPDRDRPRQRVPAALPGRQSSCEDGALAGRRLGADDRHPGRGARDAMLVLALVDSTRAPRDVRVAAALGLGLGVQVARLGPRLERLACRGQVLFGYEHRQALVLTRLELGLDASSDEDRLHLLGLRDVSCDGDLHLLPHDAGTLAPVRSGRAPPLTSAGSPRSGNGTSTVSKSRGTTVLGKISLASRASSGPK